MTVTLLIAVFGVFAASVVRGFTGFAFGLSAVPLLSLALPPNRVVPFVTVLQVLVGLTGLRSAWRLANWRVVLGFGPGLVVGVPLGLLALIELPANHVRLAIGVLIALSVVVLQWRVRLPSQPSRGVTFAAGLLSGAMNGLASMGGPPVVIYLLALPMDAAVVRASSIVYFMFAAVVTAIPMAVRGLIDREVLVWSVASIPGTGGRILARRPRVRACRRALPPTDRPGGSVGVGGGVDRAVAVPPIAARRRRF